MRQREEITGVLSGLTEHTTLLVHKRTEVAKNLRELMDTNLYLSNLSFAFLDEGFLVRKFMRREL